MTRFSGKNRRPSTVFRDNKVHEAYEETCRELGEYSRLVPRQHIYEKVKERTGLSTKTIAYILNHTEKEEHWETPSRPPLGEETDGEE